MKCVEQTRMLVKLHTFSHRTQNSPPRFGRHAVLHRYLLQVIVFVFGAQIGTCGFLCQQRRAKQMVGWGYSELPSAQGYVTFILIIILCWPRVMNVFCLGHELRTFVWFIFKYVFCQFLVISFCDTWGLIQTWHILHCDQPCHCRAWCWQHNGRIDSRIVSSQWETALLCNDVSHWVGESLEWPYENDTSMAQCKKDQPIEMLM